MERSNPWWTGEKDPKYQTWLDLKVKWVPRQTDQLSLQPFSFNFVSGPRQVGKTTMLKLLVNRLITQGTDPRSIFYYSCDELTDFRELGEVLDSYSQYKKSWKIKSSLIFLDEVSFVDEWWHAIKARIDNGALLPDILTVTGSASLDLLRQREHFPGRRGKGVDLVLRPLGFESYVEALSRLEIRKAVSLSEVEDAINANRIFSETLGVLFQQYLETGGFPLAIKEKVELGRVSEDPKKALIDGLRGDWYKVGRSDKYMKEVLSYILLARGTPTSWLDISKTTSIGSPHTARAYAETLHDLLLTCELELIAPDGKVMHRKNRKIHFADPFIYDTISRYVGVKADQAAVVEGAVASHLSRTRDCYYWRNGGEVDVIALEGKTQYGFEVKWGFKKVVRPKHLKKYLSLDHDAVPVFLASLSNA